MSISAYGLEFSDKHDAALIERYMIQRGGQWTQDGRTFGNGLIFHFKRYWSLLWPEDSQTKWTDLILKEVLENQFISLVGGASSWKTGTISRIALMDWSCFPDCTTILMSSTTMLDLQARIFGETVKMWRTAFDRHEWFPGFCIDHKCVITHEDIEEEVSRDIRNSIIGIPCRASTGKFVGMGKYCFAAGTPIDTQNGPVPIESVKVGDIVMSAIGERKVTDISNHISNSMCRVFLDDGSVITCTTDHPFLTSLGWLNAIDILPNSVLLSPNETMRIMRDGFSAKQIQPEVLLHPVQMARCKNMQGMRRQGCDFWSPILLKGMSEAAMVKTMQGMWQSVHPIGSQSSFLFSLLRSEMEDETTGDCSEDDSVSGFGKTGASYKPGHIKESERTRQKGKTGKNKFHSWVETIQVEQPNCYRKSVIGYIPRISSQLQGVDIKEREVGNDSNVSIGFGLARYKTGRGSGWELSQFARTTEKRQKEGRFLKGKRVVRVEVLNASSYERRSKSKGGHIVYNIGVEGHPSYSVCGCIVHNSGRKNRRVWCISDEFQFMELSVLEAQDNLISNGGNLLPGIVPSNFIEPTERGKPLRGYKGVFIGNPNPSRPGNPLDIVSEPENGWSSIPEDGKSKVWDCKKLPNHPVKCRCICLDSLDSPNNDYPLESPRWENLAGKHKVINYTEGSESYWSQGRGVFKFGLSQFKIITVEICSQYHAFDSLIWDGVKSTTKIGMCDASYGGGDRFALGWLEFGKCPDGKIRMLIHPYWLVPIIVRKDKTPEQQGAEFCKEKMVSVGVPPENFFFDGRGSLAMAFASEWSPKVNSIEFGGRPSDRPAGPDIFTIDPKTKSRRLKLASEHFSKFVSELWWSWRYVVESDQIRGLTMDMVLDAQPREWEKVAGDKTEIESKRDMKKRTGLSPDIADMIVAGIEGARRRGFVIEKLGKPVNGESDYRWLSDSANKKRRWLKEKLAIHG